MRQPCNAWNSKACGKRHLKEDMIETYNYAWGGEKEVFSLSYTILEPGVYQ